MSRIEHLAEGVTLYLGDCREILPTLGKVDHTIGDPPYEKEAHCKDRRVMRRDGLVAGALSFEEIGEDNRTSVSAEVVKITQGWVIFFCQVEGVAPWRDALEAAGAKYKAPMVWIKPNGMPQFNGQGPGMGFESIVAAWAGTGRSKWNGGGRHGVFTFPKGEGVPNVHETQKPLRLMSSLVSLFTSQGDTILDPYMGSGTTGVASIKAMRNFVGVERDERYFDIACKRIQAALDAPDMFVEAPKPAKQEAML
jgi:site-specific DNA-methyltransferase (adenine-specific)